MENLTYEAVLRHPQLLDTIRRDALRQENWSFGNGVASHAA
jgi:hypothetical protein